MKEGLLAKGVALQSVGYLGRGTSAGADATS